MPAELSLAAGQIVLAEWPGEALPAALVPAVVIEDDRLFAPSYRQTILVPLTDDLALAIPDLSVAIAPDRENGFRAPCWAVAHLVTTLAKARLRPTPARITPSQLAAIRSRVALAVGVER
jgi:uncharacterized protein YifN (PemK superfamily)